MCFDSYRLEYVANVDLDPEEFEQMVTEEYLDESECCGNFNLKPCLVSTKNDEANKDLTDDLDDRFTQKSHQCKRCYWFHTAMNIILDGPSLEESQELTDLLDELDGTEELFTNTSDEFFIMSLFQMNLDNYMKGTQKDLL